MTKAHLTRLWLAVGLVLVFYSINSWIAGQGGKPILDMDLIDDRPVTSALIAIPICAVLLTLLCWIGIGYAKKPQQAQHWHGRLPVIGLEDLDTGSREGRLYQGFFLFLLIAVPVAALVYFTVQALGAKVFDRQTGTELDVLAPVSWDMLVSKPYWHDRFRLGESVDKAVTWFPVLEPIVLALLLLMAAVSVVIFIRELIAGKRLPRTSSP